MAGGEDPCWSRLLVGWLVVEVEVEVEEEEVVVVVLLFCDVDGWTRQDRRWKEAGGRWGGEEANMDVMGWVGWAVCSRVE